ncbi:MAG: hypothetical protein IT232_11625 [Flavobacteriales bacterium]|nr:hypothetical protein [Flavobacteriales bacterium]
MKNKLKLITAIALVGMLSLFAGCAKDGKDGAPGPAGSPGTDGNANVKSETFTVIPGSWQTSGSTIYVDKSSSLITSSITSSGVVLVYIQSGTAWQALPYTFPQGTLSTILRYYYTDGQVQIQVTQESGTPTIPTSSLTFKLVAISSSARLSKPNIDLNDYYQVKAVFDLKD